MTAFRRYWLSLLIISMIAGIAATTASAAGKADPSPAQPLTLTWDPKSPPPTFYEPGEKLSYRFRIMNGSSQAQYVHVEIANIFDEEVGGQILVRDLTYHLTAGASIKVLHQVEASNFVPSAAGGDGAMFPETLDTLITVQAEGYPPVGILAEAWSQTK